MVLPIVLVSRAAQKGAIVAILEGGGGRHQAGK
jgi:hypothetical protein